MESHEQMNVAVDVGGGRQLDVELAGTDHLWVMIGSGFAVIDLWLRSGEHLIDMRLRVRQTAGGFEVAVDRGDSHKGWWNAEGAPRLRITIDQPARMAQVAASVGAGQDFQEVLLGRTAI
ncbi:MAG: hypothetical protein HY040_26210 [Planctomycetes bacterium]|nr:hypothetical protein [Planctomycetota bacterium]